MCLMIKEFWELNISNWFLDAGLFRGFNLFMCIMSSQEGLV